MVVWMAGKNCMCDPVNTCHFVALPDCLCRKNALYKYLILYFALHQLLCSPTLKPDTELTGSTKRKLIQKHSKC